jgi:uncharacterized protein YbjT (DUF2867 family)
MILLAGASGAIGRSLVLLFCAAGHHVIATTRSKEKFAMLRGLGADPVAVNVFYAKGLSEVVRSAQPQIVMHQLTDLPMGAEPSRMYRRGGSAASSSLACNRQDHGSSAGHSAELTVAGPFGYGNAPQADGRNSDLAHSVSAIVPRPPLD